MFPYLWSHQTTKTSMSKWLDNEIASLSDIRLRNNTQTKKMSVFKSIYLK